jgi:hypothetical protein
VLFLILSGILSKNCKKNLIKIVFSFFSAICKFLLQFFYKSHWNHNISTTTLTELSQQKNTSEWDENQPIENCDQLGLNFHAKTLTGRKKRKPNFVEAKESNRKSSAQMA